MKVFLAFLLSAVLVLLVVAAVPSHRRAIPANPVDPLTPISYWKFEETAGTRGDAVGTNQLYVTGSVPATNGIVGNGAYFNCDNGMGGHENNAVYGNDSDQLSPIVDFAFCGWIRSEDDPTGVAMIPFAKLSGFEYWLRIENGTLYWELVAGNGDRPAATSDAALGAGDWHFVYMDFRQSDKRLQIQVKQGANAYTNFFTSTGWPVTNLNNTLTFGTDAVSSDPYRVRMDEWGFWHRVLTDDEITWLFNSGAGRTWNTTTKRFE